MATRARIGLELKDGSYISSYQHWDGYPGGLGYTLIDHWYDYDKVEEAISLGDASSWRYMVGQKIDFDDRNDPLHEVQNCYYGRDRGEKDTGPKKHLNGVCLLDEAWRAGEDYLYVLRDVGKGDKEKYEWFYTDANNFGLLPSSHLTLETMVIFYFLTILEYLSTLSHLSLC